MEAGGGGEVTVTVTVTVMGGRTTCMLCPDPARCAVRGTRCAVLGTRCAVRGMPPARAHQAHLLHALDIKQPTSSSCHHTPGLVAKGRWQTQPLGLMRIFLRCKHQNFA